MRVFPEEIRIWIGEVSKTEGLPQLGEALSNPLSVIIPKKKKREGRWNLLSAYLSWDTGLPSALLMVRSSDLD